MPDRDERLSDFGDNHPFDRCVMQNLAQGCKIFFSNIVFLHKSDIMSTKVGVWRYMCYRPIFAAALRKPHTFILTNFRRQKWKRRV